VVLIEEAGGTGLVVDGAGAVHRAPSLERYAA